MQTVIVTVILLGVIGLLIGLMLVYANEAFRVEKDPKEVAVREVLPGNNCGACGRAGCDDMAKAIASGAAPANGCPVGGAPVAAKIGAIMGVQVEASTPKAAYVKCAGDCNKAVNNKHYVGPRTCEAAASVAGKGDKACQFGCLGFGSCMAVCEFGAITMVNGIAHVDRSKCKACGRCVATCPQHLIELVPESALYTVACSNKDKGPSVKKNCASGCIASGMCTRQCENGAITVNANIAHIDYDKCQNCGKCAAKCPMKAIEVRG